MPRSLACAALLVALPVSAGAQDAAAPSPRATFTPADPEVSDAEVIRWAAREIGRADGRSVGEHPPPPPQGYVARDRPPGVEVDAGAIEGAPDGLRLLAEIGGGALGLLVGGGLGGLLVWAALENDAAPQWMMWAGGAATVLGALGVSSGVALGADATGSRGNFGHAFLGQSVGAAVAVPFVVLAVENEAPELALVPAALLPLAGAVLAYELAHGLSRASDGPGPVVAYVTPMPGGVLGGVAGHVH